MIIMNRSLSLPYLLKYFSIPCFALVFSLFTKIFALIISFLIFKIFNNLDNNGKIIIIEIFV